MATPVVVPLALVCVVDRILRNKFRATTVVMALALACVGDRVLRNKFRGYKICLAYRTEPRIFFGKILRKKNSGLESGDHLSCLWHLLVLMIL